MCVLILQTLCLAIFDAILLHAMATASPDGKWLAIKRQIIEALLRRKDELTLAILAAGYADCDVLCLQV